MCLLLSELQASRVRALVDNSGPLAGSKPYWQLIEDVEAPAELFYLPWLLDWNSKRTWDTIKWILAHSLCDAGTALAIYWLHQPQDWVNRSESERADPWFAAHIAVHEDIEQRMLSLSFPSLALSYDPKMDIRTLREDPDSPTLALIPKHMKVPTPGAPIASPRNLGWHKYCG